MKILVVNAGSSSLKYQLMEMTTNEVLAKGVADRIGDKSSFIKHTGKKVVTKKIAIPNHEIAVELLVKELVDAENGVIDDIHEIKAIGHRIVASGELFKDSTLIDETVIAQMETIIDFAPLHMPAHIMAIKACMKIVENVPQVAVFDTTFHTTMPDYARYYGINYEDSQKYHIRKYGAHGTSHKFVSSESAKIIGSETSNVVVCHLGNGASISAVKDGKCVDTTMGFTPLEGLLMGTRSGDIDAAVIGYLCDKRGWDVHTAIDYLNHECGVKGISGLSSDFRDLTDPANAENERVKLAVDMFSYRVLKYIGSYAAAMDGLDMIAFTAGVGENTPEVRRFILDRLHYFGVEYDRELNEDAPRGEIVKLSTDKSRVLVYIIPTNEELVIAQETQRFV